MLSVISPAFLLFVAVLLGVWYRTPPARRWQTLLAANLVFCLAMDVRGCAAVIAASLVVWIAAPRTVRDGRSRRLWLFLGLAAALAPLILLKYSGMLVPGLWDLYKPFGIAYYSLQLTGYLLDVSGKKIPPERRFDRLLCYSTFFLSMTQGPFNRYGTLMPQLDDTPQRPGTRRLVFGAQRCAWGYFKKLAIADRAAVVVAAVFADPTAFDRSQLIFATVMYSFQLYADFSGYTDIVLGIGEMMGLALPENFRQPFLAASVHELWARWHISLSRWFRDYVYIPLGGNRRGTARRDANLMVTFLVSGLWHGAGWTFLVWGGLHGLAQVIENHLPAPLRRRDRYPVRLLGIAATFATFVVTFTIFRADSLSSAVAYFSAIVHNPGHQVFSQYWLLGLTSRLDLLELLLGIAILIAVDLLHEAGLHLRELVARAPLPVRWAVYEAAIFAFLLMARFLAGGGFLYARF